MNCDVLAAADGVVGRPAVVLHADEEGVAVGGRGGAGRARVAPAGRAAGRAGRRRPRPGARAAVRAPAGPGSVAATGPAGPRARATGTAARPVARGRPRPASRRTAGRGSCTEPAATSPPTSTSAAAQAVSSARRWGRGMQEGSAAAAPRVKPGSPDGRRALRRALSSARDRSASRSSAVSMPTDRRTRSAGTSSCEPATDAWVIRPGCSMSDSTPPSDSASVNTCVRLADVAARPARRRPAGS